MAIECTLIWRYTKEGHHFGENFTINIKTYGK